jgi:hypothetical protein
MNRSTLNHMIKMILTGLILLSGGCASTSPYHQGGEGLGGYTDKAGDTPGSFQVDYVAEGRTLAFAKYAAYYRAAELTYETGFRYFIPLNAYDLTKKGKVWGDPKDKLNGDVPGVRIVIQCYNQKPAKPSYDAYQYLNTAKLPGSELIYSVAQRKGDQTAQPNNIK